MATSESCGRIIGKIKSGTERVFVVAVRFNPPPGWKVPSGWMPPIGWTKPKKWPEAPVGWEFYTEYTPESHTEYSRSVSLNKNVPTSYSGADAKATSNDVVFNQFNLVQLPIKYRKRGFWAFALFGILAFLGLLFGIFSLSNTDSFPTNLRKDCWTDIKSQATAKYVAKTANGARNDTAVTLAITSEYTKHDDTAQTHIIEGKGSAGSQQFTFVCGYSRPNTPLPPPGSDPKGSSSWQFVSGSIKQ